VDGYLECLFKACEAARTDGSFFADTGLNERGENEWQSETNNDMKTVSYVKGPENKSWYKQIEEEITDHKERFKFRVKPIWVEGK